MTSSAQSAGRLYRSANNKMFAGVCGGIAEYLNVDPTLVRLAFVLLTVLNGAGVLIYIIMAIIVPKNPHPSAPATRSPPLNISWMGSAIALIVGLVLICLGLAWMTNQFQLVTWSLQQVWAWSRTLARFFWGAVIIAVGLFIIVAALNRRQSK